MIHLLPLIWLAAQVGQPPAQPTKGVADPVPARAAPAPPERRHALILCGHPGDAEHVKSFTDTGRYDGANFSTNCGENGSNSAVKSSVMTPVKWDATCVSVKM